VQLRRRRRQPEAEVETPQETEEQPADSAGPFDVAQDK
jgi:hypothetical protein